MIPKPQRPFRMETDASDFAVAAILSQLDEDNIWKPVAFLSKALNDAERNYEIYDKEMLAIMKGFYEWAHPKRHGNNNRGPYRSSKSYVFSKTTKPKQETSSMD